ncbi:MAG: PotD/PotF family extracellular solute-binding protein [Alphaproteobacteria bacterium]
MPLHSAPRATRRRFIAGAGVFAGVALVSYPRAPARALPRLRVGTYGGYLQDSFNRHVFPAFEAATGLRVDSVAQPTGEAWVAQLEAAAENGTAPADVSMVSNNALLRGEQSSLWAELDLAKLPNYRYLEPHFVHRDPDGRVDGVGAVSWYTTLVTNTDVYPDPPDSWAELWRPRNRDAIGLVARPQKGFLLEITAVTFFDGTKILAAKEGIDEVLAKITELKPNVKLWYRDEGRFQQALQSGEVPMGQYYHDIAGLAAAEGFPVRSTFPREGGVLDSASWAVSRSAKLAEEAHVFIDYMCSPAVQAEMARKLLTAPTVVRAYTDISAEEFAAVGSELPPIIPEYAIYEKWGDWLAERWTETIIGE